MSKAGVLAYSAKTPACFWGHARPPSQLPSRPQPQLRPQLPRNRDQTALAAAPKPSLQLRPRPEPPPRPPHDRDRNRPPQPRPPPAATASRPRPPHDRDRDRPLALPDPRRKLAQLLRRKLVKMLQVVSDARDAVFSLRRHKLVAIRHHHAGDNSKVEYAYQT